MKKIKEHQDFLHDLAALSQDQKRPQLKTPTYQKQWNAFNTKTNELNLKKTKLENDLKRAFSLFEKGIIPKIEWESAQYNHAMALVAEKQFLRERLAQWESEAHKFEDEQQRLSSNWEQLQQQQQAYCLVAPASGTLLLREGIALGSWLQAGQVLGELSPNGALIVEAYIPSHKIGQVVTEAAARYQIDAFNYRQWGMATGKVLDKGKDVELIDQTPLFKVRCSIDQTHLQLANGVEGKLQKGLGLTVLLYHNRRSLFDLLFDDINDWINPNQPQKEKS